MTLLLLLALLTPQAHTPAANIRAVLDAQVEAWNRGDLDGFLASYSHTQDLSFFSGDTVTTGYNAIAERYKKRYGTSPETMGHLAFENLEITVLAPDAAVVYGRFRLQLKDTNPTGIFTLVLRRQGVKWVIVHDHTSTAN